MTAAKGGRMVSEENDITRAANDPAIRAAVRKLRDRYPASYFGHIDVQEMVQIAIWETRDIVNQKLRRVMDVIESSDDEELKARVAEALRG
jgi:hypothetical protein